MSLFCGSYIRLEINRHSESMDSDRSDGSYRSDSSDDVSDLEPLPKRVRQTTHCENLSGKEKR